MFGDFLGRACTAMDSEDDTSKLEELVVIPAQGVGAGIRLLEVVTT
jgi:hypothetical protein